MVDPEIENAYNLLNRRLEVYKKASRLGTSISGFGALVFLLSVIPVLPALIGVILKIQIQDVIYLWPFCIVLSILIMLAGVQVNKLRKVAPLKLSIEENAFLEVFRALTCLDIYFEKNSESARIEAVKSLSKVKKQMKRREWRSNDLQLARREIGNQLFLLERSFSERLLPAIKERDVKKGYRLLEGLARYLLNPTIVDLKKLNESLSELPVVEERKAAVFERPLLRHTIALALSIVGSLIVYQVGINIVGIPRDAAFIASVTLLGAIFGGYLASIALARKE